jgi:hypothetical protein
MATEPTPWPQRGDGGLCRKFSFEAIRGMISPYDPE